MKPTSRAVAMMHTRRWWARYVLRMDPRVIRWLESRAEMFEVELLAEWSKRDRKRPHVQEIVAGDAVHATVVEFRRRIDDPEFNRFVFTDA